MIAIPAGFSPQEYLSLEQENTIRHEYRHGLVYAMAGGSDDHSRLCINFLTEVNLHLRDSDYQFFAGDVKVNYVDDFYYYPDAFITCDPRDRSDRYVKRYPQLIVEVLSPSTEEFDQGAKFEDYQCLNSLEEYVLISQDTMQVECRRRLPSTANDWQTEIYRQGDTVLLASINLRIAIADLYRGTTLTV